MAIGSLTGGDNKVKDVYTKLVFYNSSDGKFYRDTGTSAGDEVVPIIYSSNNILIHNTTSDLSSGDILRILNNNSEVFSIDHQGALHFKPLSSAPTNNEDGTLYYDSGEKTLKLSVAD